VNQPRPVLRECVDLEAVAVRTVVIRVDDKLDKTISRRIPVSASRGRC
jgi:hypothetical protein